MSDGARPAGRIVPALVIYLGLFLFAYTVPLASPAKAMIARTLGLDRPEDTWPLFTAYFLAWLVIIPPGAFLADRFGRKTMLMAGSLILMLGMLLFSVAKDLPTACLAQFLNGAGAILLQIVGVAVVTDLFAEKRGSALSLAVGLVGMVALLSPILMGELLERGVAWYWVYRWSAILPGIAFVVQLLCHFPAAAARTGITLGDVKELLGKPIFLVIIVSMAVYAIIEQGIPIWSSSYLGELEMPVRWQAFVVSAYFLVMSLVRAVVGGLRLFEKVPYPTMVAWSAVLGAVCLALGTVPNDPWMAIFFLGLTGGVIAQIWPSIMTYAVQTTGKPTATVFGLGVGIGGSTGAMLGASVLGAIKQSGLTYQQSLLTLEVPLIVLVIVFLLLPRTSSASASTATEQIIAAQENSL